MVRQYHRDTDTTYILESESYWDPEKKQSRSKRKIIGKIDKETGEIVPTGKKGRKKHAAEEGPSPESGGVEETAALLDRLREQDTRIALLRDRIAVLEKENEKLHAREKKAAQLESEVERLGGIISRAREMAERTLGVFDGE